MCVELSTWSPSWDIWDTDSMWALLFSTEALRKHFLLLLYSLSSASNSQPTVTWKCRTTVGGVRKKTYLHIMCECTHKDVVRQYMHLFNTHTLHWDFKAVSMAGNPLNEYDWQREMKHNDTNQGNIANGGCRHRLFWQTYRPGPIHL